MSTKVQKLMEKYRIYMNSPKLNCWKLKSAGQNISAINFQIKFVLNRYNK